MIHQFRGRILMPSYNLTCSSKEKDIPDCTANSIPSLGCSNYSGVRCLTHQEANPAIGMLVATFTANSYLVIIPTEMKNNYTTSEADLDLFYSKLNKRFQQFCHHKGIGNSNRNTGSCSSSCYYGMDCVMCLLAEENHTKVRRVS